MSKMDKEISFSDLPKIIKEHPFGLMISLLLLGLLLIYRGVFGCLIKIMIRLPFHLQTPDKILAGDICNPDKIFNVRLGEWIINLFQREWFIYLVLIFGLGIFLYFKFFKQKP